MLFVNSFAWADERPLGEVSKFGAYVFGSFTSGSGNSVAR